LRKGDFDAAVAGYLEAAKADPYRTEYAMKAHLVRRVQTVRRMLESQEGSPLWERMSLSLHAFYLQNEVYGEALTLDRKAHEKMKNALSASMLAETLLAMNKNVRALEFLQGLDKKRLNTQNTLYLAIARARLDQIDEARRMERDLLPAEKSGNVALVYDLARLKALLGEKEEACRLLTHCLEATPPIQTETVRAYVKKCRDFKPILSDASFLAALETESRVPMSSCSAGASCATCPSRGQCSPAAGCTASTKSDSSCAGCPSRSQCAKGQSRPEVPPEK
jgi:hypothetical protein